MVAKIYQIPLPNFGDIKVYSELARIVDLSELSMEAAEAEKNRELERIERESQRQERRKSFLEQIAAQKPGNIQNIWGVVNFIKIFKYGFFLFCG
jgi:hypothetical protein